LHPEDFSGSERELLTRQLHVIHHKTTLLWMISVRHQQFSRRHHDPLFVSSDRTFDEFFPLFAFADVDVLEMTQNRDKGPRVEAGLLISYSTTSQTLCCLLAAPVVARVNPQADCTADHAVVKKPQHPSGGWCDKEWRF
jgi:hypothetical protein